MLIKRAAISSTVLLALLAACSSITIETEYPSESNHATATPTTAATENARLTTQTAEPEATSTPLPHVEPPTPTENPSQSAPLAPPAPEPRSGWTTYTTADGLADNHVESIAVAPDGALWVVSPYCDSEGGGGGEYTYCIFYGGSSSHAVSRFDGQSWTAYTTEDGLTSNHVNALAVAPGGVLWFGAWNSGVSHFDGATWATYTTADGLASNNVNTIATASDGAVWIGAEGGASRFDGQTWTTYTSADGLSDNDVQVIASAPGGAMWIGADGGGVSRYSALEQ